MNIINIFKGMIQKKETEDKDFRSRKTELEMKIGKLQSDLAAEDDPNNVEDYIRNKAALELTERKLSKLEEPEPLDLNEIKQLVAEEEKRIREHFKSKHDKAYEKFLEAAKEVAMVTEEANIESRDLQTTLYRLGLTSLDINVKTHDFYQDDIKITFGSHSYVKIHESHITGGNTINIKAN